MNAGIVKNFTVDSKDYEFAIDVLLQSNSMLVRQLKASKDAMKKAQEHYYEDGKDSGYYILKDAIAEIERMEIDE
jgi:hypothetical protein